MDPLPDVEFVPLSQAAREYGVPPSTLRGRFSRGQLDGAKVDGQIQISRTSLEMTMQRYQRRLPAPKVEPYALATQPAAVSDLGALHAMLLRLDSLHEELRRSERENQMLRVELLRYRLALEQSERCVPETDGFMRSQIEAHEEARRKAEEAAAADAQARRQAEVAAAADAEARRKAEEAADEARLRAEAEARDGIEQARREASEAEERARHAEKVMAALARENDALLQVRPPQPRHAPRSWWSRLLSRLRG